jgi:hypothetical protein
MLTDKDLDNIKKKDSRDRIFIIFCYSTSYLVMLLAPLVMLLAPLVMLLAPLVMLLAPLVMLLL